MKIIFTLLCLGIMNFVLAQRCVTYEYLKNYPVNKNILQRTQSPDMPGRDTLDNEVITIPVVIHVLYNDQSENISDAQILSQITALNNDYRKRNSDTVNTPQPFRAVAADMRIQFCLAKVDPQGRVTSGIIRKFTKTENFLADDAVKFSSKGGDDAWDANRYLNIWVCNLLGRTLGYGVLPGGPIERDGVVIKYSVFGTMGVLMEPYTKGRTATHEIGHWLGLRHLWGDEECGDDGIADTPPQEAANSHCPLFPHLSFCSINSFGDMFMNFMDLTDDGCMNLFTSGQKMQARKIFALGGPRNSFLNSTECDASNADAGPIDNTGKTVVQIATYPNPFTNTLTITSVNEQILGKQIKIYDIAGKLFISQMIQTQKTILQVSNLAAGIYIMKIENENEPLVYKLLKVNR